MQGKMMNFGMVFLLLGLVSSTDTQEVDNITKSINSQVKYPCSSGISFARENCTGTTPSTSKVNTYLRYVDVLKKIIKSLESTYNETHYMTCQNAEKMNATMDYLNKQNFCKIPLTMVDPDMSHSSPNMRQLTKWIIWLAEAEKKVGSSQELGHKFRGLVDYTKKTACYQESWLCIEESDVRDVLNCTLPSIVANADPQDLIPISCHVLNHIHNYAIILKRSIRYQIRQARKNKKNCKKAARRYRKCMKNRKKNHKRCENIRRICKDGKRQNMFKRKNGTSRGCRKCKNKRN